MSNSYAYEWWYWWDIIFLRCKCRKMDRDLSNTLVFTYLHTQRFLKSPSLCKIVCSCVPLDVQIATVMMPYGYVCCLAAQESTSFFNWNAKHIMRAMIPSLQSKAWLVSRNKCNLVHQGKKSPFGTAVLILKMVLFSATRLQPHSFKVIGGNELLIV